MRQIAILVLVIPMLAHAQNWCHSGSNWRYEFPTSDPTFQQNAIQQVKYLGDSLFQGRVCEYLRAQVFATDTGGMAHTFPGVDHFTTTTSDLIEFWNVQAGSFDTLVWFGAQANDQWRFNTTNPTFSNLITVLDTGTSVINGLSLRYVVVESDPPFNNFSPDTIYERLGAIKLFSPYPLQTYQVHGFNEALICYSDNTPFQYTATGVLSCSIPLSVSEPSTAKQLELYPNPGNDQFTIDPPQEFIRGQLLIRDLQGRTVISNKVYSGHPVKTSALGSGTYVVELSDTTGKRWLSRWVKQ